MDAASLIMAVAVLSGLYLAWNIGANDVANAMGTSVGSGALSLRQALVLAMVFEAAGAFLAGGRVTETISQGLVSLDVFGGDVLLLSASMTACLIASAIWLHLATFMGWPVSTTHCIVGAVLGAGLAVGGGSALVGDRVAVVGVAWVVSPLVAMWLGHSAFGWIRSKILGRTDPLARLRVFGPWLTGLMVAFLTMGLVFRSDGPADLGLPAWAAGLVALAAGALGAGVGRSLIGRAATAALDRAGAEAPLAERVRRTEQIFGGLQVLAACTLAFAHGSNDVANAVGPVAVAFQGLRAGITEQVTVPTGVLLIGVVGLVIGLGSYGYKVMRTVGREITELTASSGCAAAFAAATTILVGSKLGLPVSTTHIMVGAVIGVGFARGIAAINMRVLRSILLSWVMTVPFTAALAAAMVFAARHLLG